jgi:phage regulator Rha-like protein
MNILKNNSHIIVGHNNSNHVVDSESAFLKQFKFIKNETSTTSKALQEELNNSVKTFKSQWDRMIIHK